MMYPGYNYKVNYFFKGNVNFPNHPSSNFKTGKTWTRCDSRVLGERGDSVSSTNQALLFIVVIRFLSERWGQCLFYKRNAF